MTESTRDKPSIITNKPSIININTQNPILDEADLNKIFKYKRSSYTKDKLLKLGIPFVERGHAGFFTTLNVIDEYILRKLNEPQAAPPTQDKTV